MQKRKQRKWSVSFRQRGVEGGRIPFHSSVLREIEERLIEEALEKTVACSWIIADALADRYGIREQERVDEGIRRIARERKERSK